MTYEKQTNYKAVTRISIIQFFRTTCFLLLLIFGCLFTSGCQTSRPVSTQNSKHIEKAVPQKKAKDDPFVRASHGIQGRMNYDWQLVQQIVPGEQSTLLSLPQLQGRWIVQGNNLVAEEGDKNRTILLAQSGHDPLRIELEITLHSVQEQRIGDITILLNTADDAAYWKAGYALTTGSYWNNCTTFYRHSKALANTQWSPLKPDVLHKVVLEYDHGHMRYWLDGQILLEAWDTQPLTMTPTAWIGLRTWNTHMTVHGARIYNAQKSAGKNSTKAK